MSALRPGFFLILFTLILTACSGDQSQDKTDKNVEQFPKVDTSKFREFKGDGFSIQLLKEMTRNRVSGMTVLDADFLPKEYHLTVRSYPISYYKNDPEYPKDPGKQLEWVSRVESSALMTKLQNAEAEKFNKTMVDKHPCFKQTIHGKGFGFPLRQTFFMRYYKTKDAFISIMAWTPSKNAKAYEELAQYMGMTFQSN